MTTTNHIGNPEQPPLKMIQHALDLLTYGEPFEVRIPKTRRGTVSGYYNDTAKAAEDILRYDGAAAGIYFTVNPINPLLLARSYNHLTEYAEHTTTDAHVTGRRWLPIDLDPIRPAGVSATDVLHTAALTRAREVAAFLLAEGFPKDALVLVNSGNGAHIYLRVDLPNDADALTLVNDVLAALDLHFSDDVVAVDVATSNAGRVMKVPGTLAGKGDDLPVQPHRRSHILRVPEQATVADRALLERIAAMAPKPEPPAQRVAESSFDLAEFVDEHLTVLREGPWNGGQRWNIVCPWNAEHADGAAYIVKFSNGAIAAGCHHASCANYRWADLRTLFEPAGSRRGTHTGGGRGDSHATLLVRLGSEPGVELFHTPSGDPYASFPVDGHQETWPLKSGGFRRWLSRKFYDTQRTVTSGQALQDALNVLSAKALYEGPELMVATRITSHEGAVYLDLCDREWRAVEITADGWRVNASSELPDWVRFRRASGMLALPVPERGGAIDELRRFVNIGTEDDWKLVVGWLLAALRNRGPFPILAEQGEQGSAKTTTARVLRALVDPNSADVRAEPKSGHDLMIAARNGWCIVLDNLSHLPEWLADALCRLSTGGGFTTRTLYSDDEETIFFAQRPVILNGITELATRPDLLDRSIVIEPPELPEEKRRPEGEFWQQFDVAKPRILGALLDAVAGALRELPNTRLDRLPRMADFVLWVTAAERSLGWKDGSFSAAYERNHTGANVAALEASPVATHLLALAAEIPAGAEGWTGTATALLANLTNRLKLANRQGLPQGWPRNARALSAAIRRIVPSLRKAGVEVMFDRTTSGGTERKIVIRRQVRTNKLASFASLASPDAESYVADALSNDVNPQRDDASLPSRRARLDANDVDDASVQLWTSEPIVQWQPVGVELNWTREDGWASGEVEIIFEPEEMGEYIAIEARP